MSVHQICPSLKCRKIVTVPDEARGTLVKCRFCGMEFRVPQLRRRDDAATVAPSQPATPARPTQQAW